MATYGKLIDFYQGKILQEGDTLFLDKIPNTLQYEVRDSYFMYKGLRKYDNLEIFRRLGIWKPYSFCEKVYGYIPNFKNSFPCSKVGDFLALTRLAIALKKAEDGERLFKKHPSFQSRRKDLLWNI